MSDFDDFSEKEIAEYIKDKISRGSNIEDYLKWMYENHASPKAIAKTKELHSELSGNGLKSFEDFISRLKLSTCFSTIHTEREDVFKKIENEKLRKILIDTWEINYHAFNDILVAIWKIGNDKEIISHLKRNRRQLQKLIALLNFLFGLREVVSFKLFEGKAGLEKNVLPYISFLKNLFPELNQELELYE